MASDDGLISAVIRESWLCADCIAKQTSVSPDRVHTILSTLARTFRSTSRAARCGLCLTAKTVFRAT